MSAASTWQFYEGYGQTECTAGCTMSMPGDWTAGNTHIQALPTHRTMHTTTCLIQQTSHTNGSTLWFYNEQEQFYFCLVWLTGIFMKPYETTLTLWKNRQIKCYWNVTTHLFLPRSCGGSTALQLCKAGGRDWDELLCCQWGRRGEVFRPMEDPPRSQIAPCPSPLALTSRC